MIYADDHYYTLHDVEKQYEFFDSIEQIRECQNKRLAVCLSDMFQWITLCLYIRQKGGMVFPIHPSTPQQGALRMATDASCHFLFYQSMHSMTELSSIEWEGEGGLIQMSSGTTGTPKCIERSWSSVEEELTSYVSTLSLDRFTTSIVACPVTHSYGLISGVLSCLKRGAEPVIITKMNPSYLLKKLNEHRNHIFYAAPTLLHTLSRLMGANQRFHYVMTSGTVIPAIWLESLKSVSTKVFQQYGCSEAGCVAVHTNLQQAWEMGYPLPHLRVEAGEMDAPSEIIVHTATNSVSTKDLGYVKDGILSFLARIDDTINVAGLNVYPQEVENVLMNEPRVIEAIVFRKQNNFTGERVCAQYVSEETIEEIDLREWCSKYLAPHQIPIEFERVSSIEKLPNGKVSRKKLAETYI
ncbi:AMP-binding protein [Metabacillus endolithicus]|uniref:AMP-binding protein n=1 Tax=Metabacillus endolithicus TaxID=1535204 RepID=A0ABW5BXW9_9BACI|nr:AMP-binding protein [Metabacillus endolithicus]UPG65327.1 AMP-binding protein [Metabacillus endolithicus]